MRDVLLKRIEGLSDRLVDILLVRVEADLSRLLDSLEGGGRTRSSAAAPRTPNEQLLADRREIIEEALGPDIAAMLSGAAPNDRRPHPPEPAPPPLLPLPDEFVVDRDIKPDNAPLTPTGRRPNTCTKCGFVGGNARGCGRSHPTRTAVLTSVTAPTEAAPRRLTDRIASIRERAGLQPRPRTEPEDATPAAGEQWSAAELAEERERAESRKRDGKLPRPSSSYQVEHDAPANGIPSRASVREVGPEDELDFEASA